MGLDTDGFGSEFAGSSSADPGSLVRRGPDGSFRSPAARALHTTGSVQLVAGAINQCNGSVTTATLPDPALCENEAVLVYSTAGSPAITVNPFASEDINGTSSKAIDTQYQFYSFLSDGTDWIVNPV
jgi:hypothetical protein